MKASPGRRSRAVRRDAPRDARAHRAEVHGHVRRIGDEAARRASNIAQEKSSRSLMFTELAVCRSTAPICSATCMNSALNTSSRTGSGAVASHRAATPSRSARVRAAAPAAVTRPRASPARSSRSRRLRRAAPGPRARARLQRGAARVQRHGVPARRRTRRCAAARSARPLRARGVGVTWRGSASSARSTASAIDRREHERPCARRRTRRAVGARR